MSKAPVTSNQLAAGMTISLEGKIYRVESVVKIAAMKGNPFIKSKLKNLITDELVEKSFKEGQSIQEVALTERDLEFLYLENKDYLFLDIGNLEQVLVPRDIIGVKVNYLKEGTQIKAMFYGEQIFSIELPQFLELMVVKTEAGDAPAAGSSVRFAFLETGAKVEVPSFIESGDIIKVDTTIDEYIQRV